MSEIPAVSSNMNGLNSKIPYANKIESAYVVQRLIIQGVVAFFQFKRSMTNCLPHPRKFVHEGS